MHKGKKASMVPLERVVSRIFLVRGQKVMLNADLAELYGVTTKRLNEQVMQCRIESRTLAALRDTLLPKLISGELRVKDATRLVECSA